VSADRCFELRFLRMPCSPVELGRPVGHWLHSGAVPAARFRSTLPIPPENIIRHSPTKHGSLSCNAVLSGKLGIASPREDRPDAKSANMPKKRRVIHGSLGMVILGILYDDYDPERTAAE